MYQGFDIFRGVRQGKGCGDARYKRGAPNCLCSSFFFFFVRPLYFLRPSFSSLLVVNSDPGSHGRLFPLPTTVHSFHFLVEKGSVLSTLVDLRLIALELIYLAQKLTLRKQYAYPDHEFHGLLIGTPFSVF